MELAAPAQNWLFGDTQSHLLVNGDKRSSKAISMTLFGDSAIWLSEKNDG